MGARFFRHLIVNIDAPYAQNNVSVDGHLSVAVPDLDGLIIFHGAISPSSPKSNLQGKLAGWGAVFALGSWMVQGEQGGERFAFYGVPVRAVPAAPSGLETPVLASSAVLTPIAIVLLAGGSITGAVVFQDVVEGVGSG